LTLNLAHLAQSLDCAHHSVLCLVTEVTKPQNSEAVTYIIAEASRPICHDSIVENDQTAHISLHHSIFKEHQKSKTQHRAIPLARRQAPTPASNLPAAVPARPTSLPSVSVRRCLGPLPKTRKRKNADRGHFLHHPVTECLFPWACLKSGRCEIRAAGRLSTGRGARRPRSDSEQPGFAWNHPSDRRAENRQAA